MSGKESDRALHMRRTGKSMNDSLTMDGRDADKAGRGDHALVLSM